VLDAGDAMMGVFRDVVEDVGSWACGTGEVVACQSVCDSRSRPFHEDMYLLLALVAVSKRWL
jgi:hypothetical protein